MRYISGVFFVVVLGITSSCTKTHYYAADDQSLSLFYHDSEAKEVLLAASYDRFAMHPAVKTENNVWRVTVPTREEFTYFYIVDGRTTLPDCQVKVQDDFDGQNCLFMQDLL